MDRIPHGDLFLAEDAGYHAVMEEVRTLDGGSAELGCNSWEMFIFRGSPRKNTLW